ATGHVIPVKSNETTKKYAATCSEVANLTGVELLDIFRIFSEREDLGDFFVDGLHFSRKGAGLLFDSLSPLIEKRVSQYSGNQLQMQFPIWSDVNTDDPKTSF